MTTIVGRVDLDRISEQASQVRFWRTVATLIAALLFGLGWLSAKTLKVVWLAFAWTAVALREGWREGMRPRGVS